MAKFSYGVKSIKSGGIDDATGMPTDLTDVGDVLADTATLEQADSETVDHYSEFKNDPIETVETRTGKRTFIFSLMDTAAATLVDWCGGTVTEVDGEPDVWNAPEEAPEIYKSIQIETKDGTVITIYRAKIMGTFTATTQRSGRAVIEVTALVLSPKIEGVPPLTAKDPA